MRSGAEAQQPTLPHNVTALPGVIVMSPAEVDRLVSTAKLFEGLALHGRAVRDTIPASAPTSAYERLTDIIGQIETLATLIEEPALIAQGLVDAA